MKFYAQELRVTGYVKKVFPEQSMFEIEARSGDVFEGYTTGGTYFFVARNTDKIDRDRTASGDTTLTKYLHEGQLASAWGILQIHNDKQRFDVKGSRSFRKQQGSLRIRGGALVAHSNYLFCRYLAQRQFGRRDEFDFTGYRTNLSATGGKTEEDTQECDTISRLIYGLSSAYMLYRNKRI